jgi:hypothetical protein
MALKDLLECIDPSPASETRLKLAFNLARANQAHLTGAYPLPRAHAARGGLAGFGGIPCYERHRRSAGQPWRSGVRRLSRSRVR